MARVRPAAYAGLPLVLLLAASVSAAVPRRPAVALAAVAWPPSAGLVVAEIVTGGASASDEYVEVANAGTVPMDLAGLELAYATSSGTTVTRKAAWTAALALAPGQHLLIANSAGVYAPLADALYSGGLAATGGSIVLRAMAGSVVDAVGWGDATNAFVEGSAPPAPAAGQSIERRPGGAGGNLVDTNSNAADLIANAAPVAQDLAAAPVPVGSPSPSPVASPTPTPSPTDVPTPSPAPTDAASWPPSDAPTPDPSLRPSATPDPTVAPTASATPGPTPTATPTPMASPTPQPTAAPTATPEPTPSLTMTPGPTPTAAPTSPPVPTPTATPKPTATPLPTAAPTPAPITAIADARALPDGTTVIVEGVLTTGLGALETGRTGFAQDASGGIAVYLDTPFESPIPGGSQVRVTGTIGSRYGQRTLRAAPADATVLGMVQLPAALDVGTGALGEALEGIRLRLTGIVTEAPVTLADGLGLMVDDGTGPVRVIVAPDALDGAIVATGMTVTAAGPLGQRDSSGTGVGGYRLFATLPGELEVLPAATPTPTATQPPTPGPSSTSAPTESPRPVPTPTPSSSPRPTATPTASPVPTGTAGPTPPPKPSPTPTVGPLTVAAARRVAVGAQAFVRGVVVAEVGRTGVPKLLVIADATGGLPVRLVDGMAAPSRGAVVEVRGRIADPYGQTELRPASTGLSITGAGTPPAAITVKASAVGEGTEGRLVTVRGTVTTGALKSTGGDLVLVVRGEDGTSVKLYADTSAAIDAATLRKGVTGAFTGIVGQRASRKGALDGYRIWLRDPADVATATTSTGSATPSPSPSPKVSAAPAVEPIATARVRDGATVTVEGTVTASRSLLDATGRRTVLEDASAAIELYLPAPDTAVRLGARLRVTGVVGRAWGAPRLHASSVITLGTAMLGVIDLRVAPGAATEWRLARLSGTISSVHRTGSRWVAELDAGFATVPVIGLEGAGIPATGLDVGRRATITGIVRRPYPTAADRRYELVPRQPSDVVLGAAPTATGSPGAGGGSSAAGATADASLHGATATPPGVDLRDLASRVGQLVRVGGLVTAVEADGFQLDDGTDSARVVLTGDAADLAAVVGPGDALNAEGTVELRDGPVLVVSDPAALVLAGDLGGAEATPGASPAIAAPVALRSPAPGVFAGGGPATDAGGAVALTIVVAGIVAGAGLAAFAARRLHDRRRLRARILERLEVVGVTPTCRGPRRCLTIAAPDGANDPRPA